MTREDEDALQLTHTPQSMLVALMSAPIPTDHLDYAVYNVPNPATGQALTTDLLRRNPDPVFRGNLVIITDKAYQHPREILENLPVPAIALGLRNFPFLPIPGETVDSLRDLILLCRHWQCMPWHRRMLLALQEVTPQVALMPVVRAAERVAKLIRDSREPELLNRQCAWLADFLDVQDIRLLEIAPFMSWDRAMAAPRTGLDVERRLPGFAVNQTAAIPTPEATDELESTDDRAKRVLRKAVR